MLTQDKEFDSYGFLKPGIAWNPDKAQMIARRLGINTLSDRHLAVARKIRAHYFTHRTILPPTLLCEELEFDDACLDELFDGPLHAWKIAGLPNPGEEARIYLDNQTVDRHVTPNGG